MKKCLILMMAVMVSMAVAAAESVDVGYWFDCPAEIKTQDVEGVRFGLPVSSGMGAVKGAEVALLLADTAEICGVQYSLLGMNHARYLDGLQLGFLNLVSRNMKGLQLGFFNHCTRGCWQIGLVNVAHEDVPWQIGLVNYNPSGWFPVTVLFNFSKGCREKGCCRAACAE
ncbi:MAG: hypothetical protein IJC73_04585 [Lentisphaeria bacterium]|nr:hypothetical protein [Lentisphaeria bacterium]